ncbi:Uncharacterized protein SCF082_LOCUS6158 [Durusdinium trenchii]|uniref:C2H2-type domain-containing protein n=1 Tax=Durusdinium trenchii TaxID=1381693 RepID=A0ABP0ICA4_9DINO
MDTKLLDPCDAQMPEGWTCVAPPFSAIVPGGTWKEYPHLSSRRLFSESIRARASPLEERLRSLGQDPRCLICTTGVGYSADLGGPKHWQKLGEIGEQTVIESILHRYWHRFPVPGGEIAFNELLGEVRVFKAAPAANAQPAAPQPTAPQAAPVAAPVAPVNAWANYQPVTGSDGRPQELDHPTTSVSVKSKSLDPLTLQEEGRWHCIYEPCSMCTKPNGDWQAYGHLSSKKIFKERMTDRANAFANYVYEAARIEVTCQICTAARGYGEHLGAGAHYGKLSKDYVPDGVCVATVRERLWNEVQIPNGFIRINELDGAIEVARCSQRSSLEPTPEAPAQQSSAQPKAAPCQPLVRDQTQAATQSQAGAQWPRAEQQAPLPQRPTQAQQPPAMWTEAQLPVQPSQPTQQPVRGMPQSQFVGSPTLVQQTAAPRTSETQPLVQPSCQPVPMPQPAHPVPDMPQSQFHSPCFDHGAGAGTGEYIHPSGLPVTFGPVPPTSATAVQRDWDEFSEYSVRACSPDPVIVSEASYQIFWCKDRASLAKVRILEQQLAVLDAEAKLTCSICEDSVFVRELSSHLRSKKHFEQLMMLMHTIVVDKQADEHRLNQRIQGPQGEMVLHHLEVTLVEPKSHITEV